jgi:hypothetical protein
METNQKQMVTIFSEFVAGLINRKRNFRMYTTAPPPSSHDAITNSCMLKVKKGGCKKKELYLNFTVAGGFSLTKASRSYMTLQSGILYYFLSIRMKDAKTDSEDTAELLTFITFEQYVHL